MHMTCAVCPDEFDKLEIGTHIKLMHPEVEQLTGPLDLWPDGGIVALPEDVIPEKFMDSRDCGA
jgi:hypothetical protein